MTLRHLLWVLLNFFPLIEAFNPSEFSFLNPPHGSTHEVITRCAVATITVEYIQSRFGINTITAPTITDGSCPSLIFWQVKDAFAIIKSQNGSSHNQWGNNLDNLVDANELVDLFEQVDTSRHFDSENFIGGSQIILERYQRAVDAINSLDFDHAVEYFGKTLHTLQDFYSHSTWIELGNREPHPQLGLAVITAEQFAGPTVRTCSSCATGPDAVCQANVDISKGLTSGYFALGVDLGHNKPEGKCSHGGSLDGTRNEDAVGGINKDSRITIHGYLHNDAAQTAYLATCKILRQFRAQIQDENFGKFLGILTRRKKVRQSFVSILFKFFGADKLIVQNIFAPLDKVTDLIGIEHLISESFFSPALKLVGADKLLVYTDILNILRNVPDFTHVEQLVWAPAIDFFYKAHVLALATQKHISIDIFRNSMISGKKADFGQDVAMATGGLFVYEHDENFNVGNRDNYELVDMFFSKKNSDSISIVVDNVCSRLLLEFTTNHTVLISTIQLQNSNASIPPSTIITNMNYFKAYAFDNMTAGIWNLTISSSSPFTFNLRVSCRSRFRCFSRMYVDNDNPVHSGRVELYGNLIQNQTAFFLTTCDNFTIPMVNLSATLIDHPTGQIIDTSLQSMYDSINNRWSTTIPRIPSQSFRIRISINNGQVQRLLRALYQPSLIDIGFGQVMNTSEKTTINFKLYNYDTKSVQVNVVAKNIGNYIRLQSYTLSANETRNDQFEFNRNTKATGMTSNILSLTVTSNASGWNYDILSL